MSAVILPFRRPEAQPPRIVIDFDRPSPEMSPSEYRAAWNLLVVHAREAKAWNVFVEARWSRVWAAEGLDAAMDHDGERKDAFKRMEAFVHAVATTPIPEGRPCAMACRLRAKRDVIGRVWLGAEGKHYSLWRECVADDERRLEAVRAERRTRKGGVAA